MFCLQYHLLITIIPGVQDSMFKLISILFLIRYLPLHKNLVLSIYALLLIITMYLVAYLLTRALKHRADALERYVLERTRELTQEKENVIRLLEQKNDEFTHLLHELKTSLTLGPNSPLLITDTGKNRTTNHIPLVLLPSRHDLKSKFRSWHHQVDEETLDKLTDTCEIEQTNKQKIFIEKLNNILEKQYTDSATSVNTIAKAMAMSERQFFRKLKNILGRTPTEHLKRFRLKKACFLLAQGQSAINTALDSGFSSQSYFGKCFKNEYGYPPSDFQKRLLAKNVEKLRP